MSSGRRESVLIFCTSSVKELYLAPIDHYRPDKVFVFVTDRDDRISKFERGTFKSLVERIRCPEIHICSGDTHDYEWILGEIMNIKDELGKTFDDDLDIFINITSGTHEFAAAGMFATMVPRRCTAFRVEMDDDTLECIDIDDILDGLDVEVSVPVKISGPQNKEPEKEMVGFLQIVDAMLLRTKYPKYDKIIELMKRFEVWSYSPEKKSGRGRTSLEIREERYLKRHYIEPAIDNGWLFRPTKNTMALTDLGRSYMTTYQGLSGLTTVYGEDYLRLLEPQILNRSDRDICFSIKESRAMILPKTEMYVESSDMFDDERPCFEDNHLSYDLCDEIVVNEPEIQTPKISKYKSRGKKYKFRVDLDEDDDSDMGNE